MQHDVKAPLGAFGCMTPRVRALDSLRVLHEIENLDFTVPNGGALVRLVNGHALDPFGFATFKVADRVEQRGKSGGIGHCA